VGLSLVRRADRTYGPSCIVSTNLSEALANYAPPNPATTSHGSSVVERRVECLS
jgi:hypothetical protein